MNYLLCIFLLGLISCAKDNKSHHTVVIPEAFKVKYETYKNLVADFPEDGCDWLLFQSLRDSAMKRTGLVEKAEGDPGRWYRTPGHDCYPDRSKSDISRDMLLGLGVYLWQNSDEVNAKEVVAYADANSGVMGEGDIFRTDIRPGLLATYQAIGIRAKDAITPLPPKSDNPDPYSGGTFSLDESLDALFVQTDYRAHLTVLHIYLRGIVYGGVSDIDLRILKAQAERIPRNAFYQAAYHKFHDGNMTPAINLLMDETLFPKDSLPTNANYCTEYLWQREQNENWKPCDEARTHTGADWMFAAEIIFNGFKEGKL